MCGGYWEYSGDLIVLCVRGGCCLGEWSLGGVLRGVSLGGVSLGGVSLGGGEVPTRIIGSC